MSIWTLIIGYGLVLLFIGSRTKKAENLDDLNIASGKMNWIASAFGIAASWIWAPALLVAGEKAFLQGFTGVFWFIAPNVLTLIVFAFISERALNKLKNEHTLSELMSNIYGSKRIKTIYNFELLTLSGLSVAVQLLAGANVIRYVADINFGLLTVFFAVIALIYTWGSGFRANVITDVVQMIVMMVAVTVALIVIMPGATLDFGGVEKVSTNFFSRDNWLIFLTYGLTTTIGLISGPVGDQSYWQVAFSMDKKRVKHSFMLSALIFATVPVSMAFIGFAGAGAGFAPENIGYVGLEFIRANASYGVYALFILAIISGLTSTLDSCMTAVGSIFSNLGSKRTGMKEARIGMVVVAVFGIVIANIPNLTIFWLFLFYGVLRSSILVPTVITMVKRKLPSESSIFYGILGAFFIGIPIYFYGALNDVVPISVLGTIMTVLIPTISILLGYKTRRKA